MKYFFFCINLNLLDLQKADFITELGIYKDKSRNPKCFPNVHKLDVSLYKDMLKEEKEILLREKSGNQESTDTKKLIACMNKNSATTTTTTATTATNIVIEIQDQLEAYQASVNNIDVGDNHERKHKCDEEGFLKKSKNSSAIVDRVRHCKLNLKSKPFYNSDDSGFMTD